MQKYKKCLSLFEKNRFCCLNIVKYSDLGFLAAFIHLQKPFPN